MLIDAPFKMLDQRRFLGVPIWHFAFRSFFHRYGQVFLWQMALPHPFRFVQALRRARRMWAEGPSGWVWQTSPLGAHWDLVAVGFCMKPDCPMGRFTHRCLYLELGPSVALPPVCHDCQLRPLIDFTAEQEACFYIMTSAYDIAYDLLLPNLRRALWSKGIFFLCPYSSKPFLLAAMLCGFEARLVTFCAGSCQDYSDFLLADKGQKLAQTSVAPEVWKDYSVCGAKTKAFERRGNVYWPKPAH